MHQADRAAASGAEIQENHRGSVLRSWMGSRLPFFLIPLVGLAVACGGADRPAPYSGDGTIEDPSVDPSAEPEADAAPAEQSNPSGDDECLDGEARECKIQLPTQGKTQNCFVGVQRCKGARWGACGNP